MNNKIRSVINVFRSLFGMSPIVPPLELRTISATWAVDEPEELHNEYGFEWENEIATLMADEIRKEIDEEILQSVCLMASKLHRINHRFCRESLFTTMQRNRGGMIESFMADRKRMNARKHNAPLCKSW